MSEPTDLDAIRPGDDLDPDRPRIGILTSGGDCPGLNAVICAVTKTASYLGYQVVGFKRGFEGLIDPIDYVVLDDKTADVVVVPLDFHPLLSIATILRCNAQQHR